MFLYVLILILIFYNIMDDINHSILQYFSLFLISIIGINLIEYNSNKSFDNKFYLYTITHPYHILLSKIIFNIINISFLFIINFSILNTFLNTKIYSIKLYILLMLIVIVNISSVFTLTSEIANKLNKNILLTSLLGLPISIPILTIVANIIYNLTEYNTYINNTIIIILLLLNIVIIIISLLLFPYIYKD